MNPSSGNKGVPGRDDRGSDPLQDRWDEVIDTLAEAGRIQSQRVHDAMRAHPRWRFLPDDASAKEREETFKDAPIPIGDGQTISAPHMVAILLERADPDPGERCLEIGAGSGWLAACLAHIVGPDGYVVAVEIVPSLVKLARDNIGTSGLLNVEVLHGDGSVGHPQGGPYDVIIASCGAPELPDPLIEQLAIGGRLLVPVGQRRQQRLIRVTRTEDGLTHEDLGACAFVPLLGRHGFPQKR